MLWQNPWPPTTSLALRYVNIRRAEVPGLVGRSLFFALAGAMSQLRDRASARVSASLQAGEPPARGRPARDAKAAITVQLHRVTPRRLLGAEVIYPLADHFYGERSGRLADPFGNQWILASRIETLTPAELAARQPAQREFPSCFARETRIWTVSAPSKQRAEGRSLALAFPARGAAAPVADLVLALDEQEQRG